MIQKPPRKVSLPRNPMPKSPPSGNDTDSSLDLRQTPQDARFRNRGYRKRRQVAGKRTRLDRSLDRQESSECSEGYLPDKGVGGSELTKGDHCYPEFDEELEEYEYPDDDEYAQAYATEPFPSTSYSSGKFESLDMTDNVDEMGFPKYDRLGHIRNPIYGSTLSNSSGTTTSTLTPNHTVGGSGSGGSAPPVKPQRHKKRPSVSRAFEAAAASDYHSRMYADESGNDTKGGLSDDVSEDSFAATYSAGLWQGNMAVVEASYQDFLSDNEPQLDEAGNLVECDLSRVFIPPPQSFMEDEPDEDAEEDGNGCEQ